MIGELGFRARALRLHLVVFCAFAALFALGASQARAERALIKAALLPPFETQRVKGGQIEGACGVALGGGQIFVSDYYHRTIDIFPGGSERINAGATDGYCGLALAPGGALYANEWHEAVYQVSPTTQLIDSGNSTGVAVDQSTGDLYVNDRTYIARYETPISAEEPPAQLIGLGSLREGFGLAVEGGRLYVPDAASDTVKVYEPAKDPDHPAFSIQAPGGFSSLTDAAITTDPSNGHVLVLDNLQPGFEFPEGAVEEFSATGSFLGELSHRVIDGEPSGMATSEGQLYVTNGNSEESNLALFAPYSGSFAPDGAPSSQAATLAAPAPSQGSASPLSSAAQPERNRAAPARRHKKQRHRHTRLSAGRPAR